MSVVQADVVTGLASGLPDDVVITDPDRLESYRHDKAMFCPARVPAAVVLARETGHVLHALRVASDLGVPVVPRARSVWVPESDGLAGGSCRERARWRRYRGGRWAESSVSSFGMAVA